ncbi:hypothetical protein D9M68_975420 [compost metagenome]
MNGHELNRVGIFILFIGICQQGDLLQVRAKAFVHYFTFFIVGAFCPLLDRVEQLLDVFVALYALGTLIVEKFLYNIGLLAYMKGYFVRILVSKHA